MGNCKEGNIGRKTKHAQQIIRYTAWPLGGNERISTLPAGVILLVLVSRHRPLSMLANRSHLTGGDSCCCHCIRIPRKVCLNGVVSPPICALRYCLLPKNCQFKMAIGELCCLVVDSDLGLGNKISPLFRA